MGDILEYDSPSLGQKICAMPKAAKVALGVITALLVVTMVVVLVAVLVTSVGISASSSGELLLLESKSQVRVNGEPRIVGRSYDGNSWESVSDLDFAPDDVSNPTAGKYKVVSIPVGAELKNPTDESKAFRLLSQATFGASRAELTDTTNRFSNNFGGWIDEQMKLNSTFLRSYFRRRVNNRQEGPTTVGPVREACEIGSRWNRYLFNLFDTGSVLEVTLGVGRYLLSIEGLPRGELTTFRGEPFPPTINSYPANFTICVVDDGLGRLVYFSTSPSNCSLRPLNMTNPPIEFATVDTRTTQVFSSPGVQLYTVPGYRAGVAVLSSLSVPCQDVGIAGNIYIVHDGSYYRFDPRVKLYQNTLENPVDISAVADDVCPSVVRNFVNEETCQRRPSCAPLSFSSVPITLNDATLRSWYTDSTRYVYYLQGLRLEGTVAVSPCSGRSRWLRTTGVCSAPTTLNATTNNTLFNALTTSPDTNVYIRDINLRGMNCSASAGVQIQVGGECFEHVHPNLYDVVDASYWGAIGHPGNEDALKAGLPNPIQKWAQQGITALRFPASHPITRFVDNAKFLPVAGRYGDTIDFRILPVELQTLEMASIVGAISGGRGTPAIAFQACGSRAETENDPRLGHRYQMPDPSPDAYRQSMLDWRYELGDGKSILWMNAVLGAKDQLRQRAAWALSQIFTVSEDGFGRETEIEPWAAYYDIFVRHAFGNYRDIMREVSYSPMMAEYLSFRGNRAFHVAKAFPDENYARELMQLFTIGLVELRTDGNRIFGDDGLEIATYTNEDIVDFARIWTGFDYQQPRANIQARDGPGTANIVDPMQIKAIWRDKFPKANLYDGFIGDEYPLCADRAPTHWIRQGATWVLTGDSSVEGPDMDREEDPSRPGELRRRGRFAPVPGSSALHQLLCAPLPSGLCTFPAKVVLTSDIQCHGLECNAGRIISAKIVDIIANATKYYTYISMPCVSLTFWKDFGKLTKNGATQRQCANPKLAVAMPVCCEVARRSRVISNFTAECLFANEATDFATAKSRCQAMGYATCVNYNTSSSWQQTCARSTFQWTEDDCKVSIQVLASGRVQLIDRNITGTWDYLRGIGTENVFRVFWENGAYPLASRTCGPSCSVLPTSEGDSCLCDVNVVERPVFTNSLSRPTQDEILSKLFIGATNPNIYSATTYTQTTYDDIVVWNPTSDLEWSENTIFQLKPRYPSGKPRYLRNLQSIVNIDSFSFRNPPNFIPLLGQQVFTFITWNSDEIYLPEARQEVEALLDHLFEHPNTAPFVAKRLIQRLVSSNPSPRYVQVVSDAFISGQYTPSGITFSGKYGDLGATFAAILLDREARNTILEADPSSGLVREPMVRLMQVLRAFEFQTTDTREVMMPNLDANIGQEAFGQPTVFGFYSPEFRPVGVVGGAGLASPELELATMPLQINYLNGISSLMNRGLTSCNFGLGYSFHETGTRSGSACSNRSRTPPDGDFKYIPTATDSSVVDELDKLLTGGRLHNYTREFIREKFETTFKNKTFTDAYKLAQKLIISSVEFQATNAHVPKPEPLDVSPSVPSQGRPYKALIVVFEAGGADTFNLLVPHSNCGANGDLYSEYAAIRGDAALPLTQLNTIAVPAGTQPCNTFGVHSSMPNLKSLYDANDALFMASIGALIEPTTKLDFQRKSGKTVQLPPSLFAHNTMTKSMQNLNPDVASATGILGRTVQTLKTQPNPFSSEMYSLAGFVKMLEGSSPPDAIDSRNGVRRFEEYPEIGPMLVNMTKNASSSRFGTTYSKFLQNSLNRSEYLSLLLRNTTTSTNFSTNGFSLQLQQVAKLIKLRNQLKTERAVFFVQSGGYDTHNTFDLTRLFGSVDTALGSLVTELKLEGVWDSTAIVTVSEFGRTLTPNGAGTDHGWSGHHFLAGGAVKGGRILGKYPESLQLSNDLNLGRGRFLPTNSWEAVWKGLIEWFGVNDPAALANILPNLQNFPSSDVWSGTDLFN